MINASAAWWMPQQTTTLGGQPYFPQSYGGYAATYEPEEEEEEEEALLLLQNRNKNPFNRKHSGGQIQVSSGGKQWWIDTGTGGGSYDDSYSYDANGNKVYTLGNGQLFVADA